MSYLLGKLWEVVEGVVKVWNTVCCVEIGIWVEVLDGSLDGLTYKTCFVRRERRIMEGGI